MKEILDWIDDVSKEAFTGMYKHDKFSFAGKKLYLEYHWFSGLFTMRISNRPARTKHLNETKNYIIDLYLDEILK